MDSWLSLARKKNIFGIWMIERAFVQFFILPVSKSRLSSTTVLSLVATWSCIHIWHLTLFISQSTWIIPKCCVFFYCFKLLRMTEHNANAMQMMKNEQHFVYDFCFVSVYYSVVATAAVRKHNNLANGLMSKVKRSTCFRLFAVLKCVTHWVSDLLIIKTDFIMG